MDFSTTPLTQEQVRVLGALMEKHLATPNNYPLTANSLTLACNQKSNRHPVLSLEEGKVVNTAQQLNELGLVSIEYGERVNKFSHRAPGAFGITREQQGVLSILMLREPLTLADIKARTEKTVGFDSIEDVKTVLQELSQMTPAMTLELPLFSGQREERYTHILAGEPDLSQINFASSAGATSNNRQSKIDELEARIARLEAALDLAWPTEDSSPS